VHFPPLPELLPFLFFITSPAGRRSPAPNLEARVCNANALLLCVKNFQSGGLLLREGGGLLLREGGLGALLLCVQNFQSGGLLLRQGSGLLLREGGLGGLGGLGGGSGGGGGGGLAWRSTTGARREKLIFFMADQSSALGPHPQRKCNRATVHNAMLMQKKTACYQKHEHQQFAMCIVQTMLTRTTKLHLTILLPQSFGNATLVFACRIVASLKIM
jgi:hypothetical protein